MRIGVCGMLKILSIIIAVVILLLPSFLAGWRKHRFPGKIVAYNLVLGVGVGLVEWILIQFGYGYFCSFLVVFIGVLLLCGWSYLSYLAVNR